MTFHPADVAAVMASNKPRLIATAQLIAEAIKATQITKETVRK